MTSKRIAKRHGAYLPHWTRDGGVYGVRFRLADSVPQEKLREWEWQRKDLAAAAKRQCRELTASERLDVLRLHTETVDQYLRSGHGSCRMRSDAVVAAVADALRFFDGSRYRLFAWCVMPNHVHVVVRPWSGHALPSIVRSWKTYTARKANALLGRTGMFWQSEYFDRLIRNADELRYSIEYVWSNPEMAGLKAWKWRWKMSDLELHAVSPTVFGDARAGGPCRHAPEAHATASIPSPRSS